ncbi:uncharacterized protein ZBAI_07569 [Zygosaccharomyces bailii ISA1307]|nr:uncharacterized protein ZBAI_07569 [Zygosaccharomyces bailii ISA1307]
MIIIENFISLLLLIGVTSPMKERTTSHYDQQNLSHVIFSAEHIIAPLRKILYPIFFSLAWHKSCFNPSVSTFSSPGFLALGAPKILITHLCYAIIKSLKVLDFICAIQMPSCGNFSLQNR